ncbi:HNH endonuclease [Xenorhabdus sp. XENO-1]|uniref:HNH endonuclease n=1 Tax=Xenorhabdus bovienii TaxID=40576 RepID=UPI0020CA9C30|nr:HNH endonuclease [Xenorhabdus bovienii]MCP9269375.1 HNH endonuclease [Xenorhabdus bovienii subsp. africana]
MNKICYLTGEKITESNKSLEHIIPNALYGHLTSSYILTKDSNNLLGADIDKDFETIFHNFTSRLSFKRDRGRNPNFQITCIYTREQYFVSGGKIAPLKPFYDKNTNTVYARDNRKAKQILKKELGDETGSPSIKNDKDGLYEWKFNIENREFKRGMAKISAGFAALHGVERSDLIEILDLNDKKIKENPAVIPFIPLTFDELAIEENIDKLDIYPFHAIELYGNPEHRLLYCYIDLFSTFQYLIVLNGNYQGEYIHKSYFYSMNKEQVFSFDEYKQSVKEKTEIDIQRDILRKIDSMYLSNLERTFLEQYHLFQDYGHKKYYALDKYTTIKMHSDKGVSFPYYR